jgi:hypothetical protein
MLTTRAALQGEDLAALHAEAEEIGFEIHKDSITPSGVVDVKHFLVSRPCFTSGMNDDALIRLSNLKALSLTPKHLSDRVGGRVSYWADMLRGEKSFGEKVARKIEEQLGLPRMSLDTSDADEPIPTPQPTRQENEQIAQALGVLTKALQKADKNTRIALEPLLASMANEPEDAANKSRLILRLLVTAPVLLSDTENGRTSGELGRLTLGDEEHGRSDRTAAKGGGKR